MQEWESDPLFFAAEVVQDSADRMESIFRFLLHEQNQVKGDHPDTNLLSSIEYHRRDLATTLETAKWQLEDFEREVNNKSQMKQNVMMQYKQFIGAIREQIIRVEQNMNTSAGNFLRNRNLNEQDTDGLALFLSGGKPVKHIVNQELEDNNILRKFLDPAVSSSSMGSTDEQRGGNTVSLNENNVAYSGHNLESNEISPTQVDLEDSSSVQEAIYDRFDEKGSWDLEANEKIDTSYLQKYKPRSYWGRINIPLRNFLSIYGNTASRSFTKRLKDGEEQRQSPSYDYFPPAIQRCFAQLRPACGFRNFYVSVSQLSAQIMPLSIWIRDRREKFQRSLHDFQVRHHPLLLLTVVILTLLILGIMVF